VDDCLGCWSDFHEHFYGWLNTVWLDELVDTYELLEKKLGLKKSLPITEDWSAAADFLLVISNYCLSQKPQVIVECSSGTSSIVLARCCQKNTQGHVYSLENGAEYEKQTRQQLDDFSLAEYCDVVHAPLQDYNLDDVSFQWYEKKNLTAEKIDMLVIDGPPGFIQKQSRYPALPLLHERLAEQCVIFMDDAARDDEKTIVKRWLKSYPEFQFEYVDNSRGCSILKRT